MLQKSEVQRQARIDDLVIVANFSWVVMVKYHLIELLLEKYAKDLGSG